MAFDLTAFIAAARAAAAHPGATARIRALLGHRVRHELFRWDTGEALEFNDANFSALIRRAGT